MFCKGGEKMKFKKIPEEKFSWSRVFKVVKIFIIIMSFISICLDLYFLSPLVFEYSKNFPELYDCCVRYGCLSTLLLFFLVGITIYLPEFIRVFKEYKGVEK